jgi:hypothetical protein
MLSIDDLCKESLSVYKKEYQIYKTLLHEITTKIKEQNSKGKFILRYKVPYVVYGNSKYKFKTAIVYIMKELTKGKFIVLPLNDNCLYIDWSIVVKMMKQKTNHSVK